MVECFKYEVVREGGEKTLLVDVKECPFQPSVEDSRTCMGKLVDALASVGAVSGIVLSSVREYEYDFSQTSMLVEIAEVYQKLKNDARLSYSFLVKSGCERHTRASFARLQYYVGTLFKSDPLGAYVELKRMSREEKIRVETASEKEIINCISHIGSAVDYVLSMIEGTKLITSAKRHLPGFKVGEREIYRNIFHPTIKPDFMFTKLMSSYPAGGEVLANYRQGDAEVTIFGFSNSVKTMYHLVPPEFKFDEQKYEILDTARKVMSEHAPNKSEFVDPKRMREVFYNVGKELISDLVKTRGFRYSESEIKGLARVLLRYTVGFGLIEILLGDDKVQDVSVNSPLGKSPIFIVHGEFGDCETNIIPTMNEAESWATKLRLISGRPLDEANPILDTELRIPGMTSRVSAVTAPLNPSGLAFSFRRHRDKPWTLPLFMNVGMINDLAAGVMSFLIDGTRTMLICGTRSSGKTSLLGSVMVDILRRYRIITIEDTLELPVPSLTELGFNIQSLKVSSALSGTQSSEVSASDGIRSTLRLGDSALIVGEVRSEEAKALYEAMRIGAAANVVAGTIHGDSPYGVFDRVVNDIGVPATSFKATDIIVIANPVKSASGLKRKRRVLSITEVRKTWNEDPLEEGGFVDLLKYNPHSDSLEITDELMNGNSDILKLIASNIKELSGNWDAVWEDISSRAGWRQKLVELARSSKNLKILEAKFVTRANEMYHKMVEIQHKETGGLESNRLTAEMNEWIKHEVKKGI